MNKLLIMIVDPDEDFRGMLCGWLDGAGYRALSAPGLGAARALLNGERPAATVCSVGAGGGEAAQLLAELRSSCPRLPVILVSNQASVELAVDVMRAGAADLLVKPLEFPALKDRLTALLGARADGGAPEVPIAESPLMAAVLGLARRVAESDATILLTGESGTGKEVFARYIHRHSRRGAAPFVALNCAAVPENLLEAVLFGHEKGAYTGAHEARAGKFEQAQGGTLLLDEVSEMPLELQAKLLRVLQEREVERLGGRRPIPLDVRVLATTNRDLLSEVEAGHFRQDLFYRLNVFPIHLPPLRERKEDILALARRSLTLHGAERGGVCLSDEAEQRLLGYRWPGNVRELDNVIQRALILADDNIVDREDIRFAYTVRDEAVTDLHCSPVSNDAHVLEQDLWLRERELILAALNNGNGSRKCAAARLGISPRTLRYKLARMRDEGVVVPGCDSR